MPALSSRRQVPAFVNQKQICDGEEEKPNKSKIRTREKDSASLKIILSVRAFDHDRDIVLDPLNIIHVNAKSTRIHAGNMTAYLQHRCDDYRIFSLEVMGYAHGEHLNCDDLACTARRAVHAWIAHNEEFGKLVHEFAGRTGAASHELRAIRERSKEFWAPGRGETLGAQVVVRWEVTVELSAIVRPNVGCMSVRVDDDECGRVRTSIQDSQSIGRMPIVTL
jgi:hypothetical protein